MADIKPLIAITGASSGIGAAIARDFSEAGHPVLLLGRRLEKMQMLNLENCEIASVDINDRAATEAAIRNAEEKHGKVDCLINNAGVMLLGGIEDQDSEQWQRMFDLNVVALLNTTQIVLGDMIARKGGTIINISSTAGRKSYPSHAAYCGSKFAVHGLTETLRSEVAKDDVRVMIVGPGATETELLSHTTDDGIKAGYEEWKKEMGGVLDVKDVSRSVLFAYQQPQNVCIRELLITATRQDA
jgi:NADP-dependent 3-hydroxy acid dehydrogenase YdfG